MPSVLEPMYPPMTGTFPSSTSGAIRLRAAIAIASACGSALPKFASVIITFRASTCTASIPRARNAAAISIDDARSPMPAIASRLRGVMKPRTDSASQSDASSSKITLTSAPISLCSSDSPSSASTSIRCRSRSVCTLDTAEMKFPSLACRAMPSSALVTPASADTTTTGRRSSRPRTISAVRVMAAASATEVPPNLLMIMPTGSRRGPRAALRSESMRQPHRGSRCAPLRRYADGTADRYGRGRHAHSCRRRA